MRRVVGSIDQGPLKYFEYLYSYNVNEGSFARKVFYQKWQLKREEESFGGKCWVVGWFNSKESYLIYGKRVEKDRIRLKWIL